MAQGPDILAALAKAGCPLDLSKVARTLPTRITGLNLVEAEAWLDWLQMHDIRAELEADGDGFLLRIISNDAMS